MIVSRRRDLALTEVGTGKQVGIWARRSDKRKKHFCRDLIRVLKRPFKRQDTYISESLLNDNTSVPPLELVFET